jgi:hypothetical protein
MGSNPATNPGPFQKGVISLRPFKESFDRRYPAISNFIEIKEMRGYTALILFVLSDGRHKDRWTPIAANDFKERLKGAILNN